MVSKCDCIYKYLLPRNMIDEWWHFYLFEFSLRPVFHKFTDMRFAYMSSQTKYWLHLKGVWKNISLHWKLRDSFTLIEIDICLLLKYLGCNEKWSNIICSVIMFRIIVTTEASKRDSSSESSVQSPLKTYQLKFNLINSSTSTRRKIHKLKLIKKKINKSLKSTKQYLWSEIETNKNRKHQTKC